MKTDHSSLGIFYSLFLILLCAAPPLAHADNEESLLELSIEELMKIDVITVTARKRAENLHNVPMSISEMHGEKLDVYSSAGTDIRFLNARAPSLTVESSFGRMFPRFYLRGLGNTDFDINASQPVSVVVDEVVHENPMLKGFPVFDTDRIEVLHGPQGSLFGRNTPAGVLKFESRKPTQELESYASLALGTHETIDFEGAASGGLSNSLSARVSLLHQQRSYWVDNNAPGFEEENILDGFQETAGRIQLLFEPNKDFSALVNYHFRNLAATPIIFRANIIAPGTNNLVAGFDREEISQDAAGRAYSDLQNHGGVLKLEQSLNKYTLTSVTGIETVDTYSLGDIDGGYGAAFLPSGSGPGTIPFPSETEDGLPEHIQFTQELRISSDESEKLSYQLGVFYFHEDLEIDSRSFDTLAGGTENGFARQEQKTNAGAVFGTVSFDATEKLKLTAGARASLDKKDFSAERLVSPAGAGALAPIEVSPEDEHLSWDLSAIYELNEAVNLYARLANGFRAPSVQGRILFGDEVTVADSETIHSFEVGLKSDILDGRGRVNTSVFYYTMDGQQLTAVGGDSNFNRLVNADKTIGYGAELDAEFALTPSFNISANMSYNYTELQDDDLAIAACAQCTVLDPTNELGLALIDGNSLPHAPEWIANVVASYQTELGGGEFFALTDWRYRSKINFFLYESEEFTGDSIIEGGVKAGYRWKNDGSSYEVSLFARNITDEEALIGGVDFNNLTGFLNEGRFVGCEFRMNFS